MQGLKVYWKELYPGILPAGVRGGRYKKNETEDNESVPTYQETQRDTLQVTVEVILPLMSHYGVLGTAYFGFKNLRRVTFETLIIKG